MYAEQIVANSLARTFYGNRLWGDMSEKQKVQATADCLSDARQLQSDNKVVFATILRLRQSIDENEMIQ